MDAAFHDPQFFSDRDIRKVEIKPFGERYVIIIDDHLIFLAEEF
jgi:hypothetical protein